MDRPGTKILWRKLFNCKILLKLQDSTGVPVTLKVDPNGFFLYYHDQNDVVTLIDFFHIRDIRTGDQAKTPRDQKVTLIVK